MAATDLGSTIADAKHRVVVVAPDKFKGSLTADQVARALAAGILSHRSDLVVHCLPIADGGDGTLTAAETVGYQKVLVSAPGPTGEPLLAAYARREAAAIIELAEVAGSSRLPGGKLNPLCASTYGVGVLVRHALENGCRSLILAVGGSASTDGGAGLLQALGARLLNLSGRELSLGGSALASLASVDLTTMHPLVAHADFLVAHDVDNPLLGPTGSAAVYGPQKGADAANISLLEKGLARWAKLLTAATGRDCSSWPGAGAAGGAAFAAFAALQARSVPGAQLVLDMIRFNEAVSGAALVVTGEGSLDLLSLHGKAPVEAAKRATAAGVPVVAVAGRCLLSPMELARIGIKSAYSLLALEPDETRSIENAVTLLKELGSQIAKEQLACT